jgi:hypothetical protein
VADEREWPAGKWSSSDRAVIIARDTPLGMGRPLCWTCGLGIAGYVEIHHRKFLGRGGDNRLSNGISLHPQMDDYDCHIGRCHHNQHAPDDIDAALAMWAISRHAHAGAYYEPVFHAVRGWVLLDDGGGWQAVS